MADKYSDSDLVKRMHAPGWKLETGQDGKAVTGTLAEIAKAHHDLHAKGEAPGLIREIETAIELDMLQISMLWRQLGLPV